MTRAEDQRQGAQERMSDSYFQLKSVEANARNQAIIAYVTGATFLGAIIVSISIAQAKEVVRPTREKQIEIDARVNNIEAKFDKVDVKLDILIEMSKK